MNTRTVQRIFSWLGVAIFLLVFSAILWPVLSSYRYHQAHLGEVAEIGQRILQRDFLAVQSINGGVLMTPRPTGHFRIYREPEHREAFWREPLIVPIGFSFRLQDHHWGATYTITKIESDGVVVRYEYNGGGPAIEGHYSGLVKVGWK